MSILVFHSFEKDIYVGIRSFAGVLLPIIIVTFIALFQKELLRCLGKIPTLVSFFISLFIGIIVMDVVHIFAGASQFAITSLIIKLPPQDIFDKFSLIPIIELVLSGSLSILVFSYIRLKENRLLSYYYGMICGFLLHIIIVGFPILSI